MPDLSDGVLILIAYWAAYAILVFGSLAVIAANGFSPDWVEALSTAAGTLIAGFAAITGLRIWRVEAVHRRKAELAEEIMLSAARAVEVIRSARTPLISLSQMSLPGENSYEQRLEYLRSSSNEFAALDLCKIKASLFLTPSLEEALADVKLARSEIMIDLETLVEDKRRPLGSDSELLLRQARARAISSGADALEQRLQTALQAIKRETEPLFRMR